MHQNRAGLRAAHMSSRAKLFVSEEGGPLPELTPAGMQRGMQMVAASGSSVLGLQSSGTDAAIKTAFVFRLTARGFWQRRKITLTERQINISAEKPPTHREGLVHVFPREEGAGMERRYLVLADWSISMFASHQAYIQDEPALDSTPTASCVMRITKVRKSRMQPFCILILL